MPRANRTAAPAAAPEADVQAPAVKTDKRPARVTVACKIHTAVFTLELCAQTRVTQEGLNGSKEVDVWNRTGRKVQVAGMAYPVGTPPDGYPPRPQVVGGYALTHDVDGEFWREWQKQHARAPYVLNKMIMAYPSLADVKAASTDTKDQMSGLEPVQRKKVDGKDSIADPRVGKSANAAIQTVHPGERLA